MIEFILENMHEKGWRAKVCAQFRITPSWLSIVWHTDAFREAFSKRLSEWRGTVSQELQAAQIAICRKAYERLSRILESDAVEDQFVLDVANSTMKNLGFAPSPGARPQYAAGEYTRETTRTVAPGVLETARERYRMVTSDEPLPAITQQ
jgi:hypothetical protein